MAAFLDLALPKDCAWTSVDSTVQGGDGRAIHIMRERKKRGIKADWPDAQLVWRGRFIALECKVGDNGLEPGQVAMRDLILRAGGFWHTVRTLDEVEAALRGHGIPLSTTAGGFLGT